MINNALIRIIIALVAGILLGLIISPELGYYLNFFSDLFIRLLSMLIGPIVFCTIVIGIGQHQNLKQAGRIGIKSIIYFECVTTVALIMAMLMAHFFKPGMDLNIALDHSNITPVPQIAHMSLYQELLDLIPDSLLSPFVEGNILHILVIAIMIGIALVLMKDKNKEIIQSIVIFNELLFSLLNIVISLAPIAVFGSITYTISKFGLQTLINLGEVILLVFVSCLLFIIVVLGIICRLFGLKLTKILYFIREEILLTFATSSSEIVLPQLMKKLTASGCDNETVALVLPTGYSFNMDGMSIYLGIAVIFMAQVAGINLTWSDELFLIGYMLLISKGAAGVTGSGFITLAAIITTTNILPSESLVLLLSIDRFMSIARSVTNMIGNVVATVIINTIENKTKNYTFNQ